MGLDIMEDFRATQHYGYDVDWTLYPKDTPVIDRLYARQIAYLRKKFGFTYDEALEFGCGLYNRHHSVLIGLREERSFTDKQIASFMRWCFKVDHKTALSPCDEMKAGINAMRSIPDVGIHVFTNGTKFHAKSVLQVLGLDGMFGHMVAQEHFPRFSCKPFADAYEIFERRVGSRSITFFDDSLPNIHAAFERGWQAVLVEHSAKANPLNILSRSECGGYWITENLPALCKKIARMHTGAFAFVGVCVAGVMGMMNSNQHRG